jgi:hypothetical protein
MPAIRIAEIPNAGPRAVAASTANIGVPRLGAGLSVEPRVAQATGAAMMDNSSTQRAAASMLSQTLQQGAFTAEAEAGMRFGAAIGQVGQVLSQFGEKFAAAKDTADLARAETTMRAAFEKQQNEQQDLPSEKWKENWERNLQETRKALAEIKFSNNAAERLGPSWQRWTELSSIQVDGQVRKKQIEGFRMDVEANALMKVASEDLTGAIAIYEQAVRDGIFTPEEGNMAKARLRDNEVRKARQENRDRLVASLNSQPWDMLPLFNRRAKGEEVPELGDISPPEAASLAGATRQVVRTQMADMDDEITQRIFNGELSKPDEIDAWAKYLPAERLARHKKFLSDKWEASPERWAQVTALRPVLLTEIENYSPDKDDNEWTEYFRIKDMVNHPTEGMPPGEKREFLEMLYAKRRKEGKAQAPAVRQRMTVLNEMYNRGYFGRWDKKNLESKNDKVRNAEFQKMAEAGTKHMELLDTLTTWAERNPDKASDPSQVADFFQRMVNPDMVQAAIDLTEQVIRDEQENEPLPPVPSRTPRPVDSLTPAPQAGAAAPPAGSPSRRREPASIRNNNAGAMWPAQWQKKFGGKHGENLKDGKGNKIAKFPTKVQGAAATMYLLGNDKLIYAKRTVRDGIKKWSNASGTSLRAYIKTFENAGFGADETIGEIMADEERAIAFTKAMSRFEAGQEFPMSEDEWLAAYDMFRSVKGAAG